MRAIALGIVLLILAMPVASVHSQDVSAKSDEANREGADTEKSLKEVLLREIVVTATRMEVSKEEVPASVDVITSFDLNTTFDSNLTRVLKKNSTVDVIDYPGVLSGVSIRGFRPEFSGITKHYLVLIDGRPAGATNIATIMKGNVERIEILKGPASSLYGGEAMGGVINVITKKSRGKIKTELSAGGGSFDTLLGSIKSGGSLTDRLNFDFSVYTKRQLDDFEMGNGETRHNTTYRETHSSIRFGYDLSSDWSVEFKSDWYAGRNIEAPNALFYGDTKPSKKDIDRYGGDLTLAGRWLNNDIKFVFYAAHEESDYTKKYQGQAPYRSYANDIDWLGTQLQNTFNLGNHDITVGLDYQDIDVGSKSWRSDGSRKAPYSPNNERQNVGVFGDAFLRFFDDRVILNGGVRYDWYEVETKETPYKTDFHPGSETFDQISPRMGVKFFVTGDRSLQLHGTVGRAFVPPKADQMAGYSEREVQGTVMVLKGNPDLEPEKSVTWDVGITYQRRDWGLRTDITYFDTSVDDKITRVKLSDTLTTYENAIDATIRGIELEFSWNAGSFFNLGRTIEFFVNASHLFKAEEDLPDSGPSDIHNVAHWKVNAGIQYDDGTIFSRLLARYMGKRKDYDWYSPGYPVITYDDFLTFDLTVGLRLFGRHEVTLNIENLTDEYYYEKPEFPLPGRAFYLTYTLKF